MSTKYLPRRDPGKAELHLTYACDLACVACNRASFLKNPPTGDMTLEDAASFFDQARELDWHPDITIIGGEPTMHPGFVETCRLAREYNHTGLIQVWSNNFAPGAESKLLEVREKYDCSIPASTWKPDGSVNFADPAVPASVNDMYVSPTDLGLPLREPCFQHSSIICGVSVGHEGYSPCAVGGTIAGLLGVNCRAKRLADLFDPDKMAALTAELCRHCGYQLSCIGSSGIPGLDTKTWQAHVASCKRVKGTPMSPTWEQAFQGRR